MAWIDVGIAAVEVGSEAGIGAGAMGAFDLGALGLDAGAFGGSAFELGGLGAEGLGGLFGLGGEGGLGTIGGSFAGQPGFTLPSMAADVVSGGAGAGGAGINAAQVGAAENIATGAGAGAGNQVANLSTGTMTDVGANPDYTAWKNAIANNQYIPENPLPAGYETGAATNALNPSQVFQNQMVAQDLEGAAKVPLSDQYAAQDVMQQARDTSLPEGTPGSVYNPAPTSGGLGGIGDTLKSVGNWIGDNPGKTAAGLMLLSSMMPKNGVNIPNAQFQGANPLGLKSLPSNFQGQYPTQPTPYQAQYRNYVQNPYSNTRGYAAGGITNSDNGATPAALPPGGPVEAMSRDNALGQNQMFPQSQLQGSAFSSPTNTPMGSNMIAAAGDTNVDPYTGAERFATGGGVKATKPKYTAAAKMAAMPDYEASLARFDNANYNAQMPTGVASGLNPTMRLGQLNLASGGIASLGGYSDGGQLLKGPGDGMSDSIPAKIGHKQPARLADGEFVVPADVVSHLGNGSTDAGAKHLYKMMDRIRQDRTGRKAQGKQINPTKYMPK